MRAPGLGPSAALGGVAVGIVLADAGTSLPVALLLACATLVAGLAVLARMGAGVLLGVALLGMALGGWRSAVDAPVDPAHSVARLADGRSHDLVGTVAEDPRPRGDRLQLVVSDVRETGDSGAVRFDDRLLAWLPRGIEATSGDRVRLGAEVELAADFDGFAYREFLARQGIGAIARARDATVEPGPGGPAAWIAGLRNLLLGGLNDIVPEPEAALGAGILLGVRAAIAPEINDAFAAAGLTHVVAISGWNIAIVAALVAAMVRPLETRPGGRWTTAVLASTVVGGYVLLAGAGPSVVRAALMAAAMLVARLGGSRTHATSALVAAALVMLLAAPAVLWDVGFQLSALATAGLIWFGASVERRLPGWPGWIREPVALTLAAQITTLPIILLNFERLSLVAPLANVLVVPFVPPAMLACAAAAVVGVADGALHPGVVGDLATWFVGGAAWLTLRVIVALGTASASLPLAAVDVRVPPALAGAWFGVLGLGSWALRDPDAAPAPARAAPEPGRVSRAMARLARPLPALAVVAVVLAAITFAARPDGRLHVTVMNAGQGDAILVEAPGGETMLVDGGPDPELTLRRIGANLAFFQRRIDLLVLTHPHQDHVAGLVDAVDRFHIGALLHAGIAFDNPAYDHLLADATAAAVPVMLARADSTIMLGPRTALRIAYPTAADAAAPLPDDDINNGSVVLELRFGEFTALLTGDAEAPVEASLLARGELAAVDLLKVGHHGSRSSTTPAFLAALSPSIAVISVGIDNDYGHPAPETLANLAGVAVRRTDLDGDVEIVTDGRTFTVRTDAGVTAPVPVHAAAGAGSIGPWPSPIDPLLFACSTRPACPTGSWSTRAASLAWRWPPPASWPKPRSRLTSPWSRPRPSCTTSTRSRSGAPVASTAWLARAGSRPRATPSSPCRSPPTRSPRSSTTIASRSAGRRSSWPSPTGTWRRRS